MNSNDGRPIVARVIRKWEVPPGLTYALVVDVEGSVWVVEACPAGTHFWTLARAAELPRGDRTRSALNAAVRLGRTLQRAERRRGAKELSGARPPGASSASDRSTSAGRRGQRRTPAGIG
jgi:hypothetical protein